MAKRNFRNLRGLATWFLALSQLTFVAGCRQDGYKGQGNGNGAAASTAAGSTTGPNLGEIIYNVLHQQLTTSGTQAQVTALETDHATFVDAINRTLPTDVSKNLWSTLQKILPLIDDNTIPAGVGDVEGIMKDLLASPTTIQALADLSGTQVKSSLDPKDAIRLVSRLLAYPQLDDLGRACNDLVKNQPDVLKNVLALLSRKMQGMTPATFQGNGLGLQSLSTTLLAPADTTGLGDLGAPAWAVHLDKNGNPRATIDPATQKVVSPFVDDGSGNAAVGSDGKPVDSTGARVAITPFGTDGSRDSEGRALSTSGLPLFDYFDAKKTLLGEALVLVGQLLKQDVPGDLVTALDKSVARVQHADPNDAWSGFSSDNPFIDLTYAQMELVRRTPANELLEGLAQLVKQDPARFEQMVTSLVSALNLAKASGFSTAGQASLVDDLLPLLSDAAKPQGNKVSAVRALLESFNSAQAQLHNLPQGFALMMTYNDYGKKIPTSATAPSAMQRLLTIMDRSNQCSPPILGNLADLYLDTMAGNNKAILGIKLDIHTMNSLLGVGILRNLLCSQIQANDVGVLQDFADTGTLDAFIPIAKAFSDRGETHLLTEIMLKLNAHYAAAMTPNEPGLIKLLNSGAVEKLFGAIDNMTQVTVTSSGNKLIDVLADTVGAVVDDSHPLIDRKGRTQKTLVNLLKAPLDDLSAAATAAGVKSNMDNALTNVMNTLLATYKDASGNDKLVYSAFVSTLGSTLDFVSKQIPSDAAARGTWCDQQEQSISDLLQSRDVAAGVDIFLSIRSSPNKQVFTDAIVNLFTPVTNAQADALGAILELAASLIECPPSNAPAPNAQAIATVVNWLGAEMDPKAGKLANMTTMVERIVAADDGLLLLKIVRNMTDMGANGQTQAAILDLVKVLGDVRNAGGASAGPVSASDISAMIQKGVTFMDDQQNGLPHLFDMVKHRTH